jgi:branched-subunit amino acid ABC-type transport system permease component
VLVGLLAIGPFVLSPFYVTLMNYIGLYAMVALGLVLLTGVAGLTSFGQAAFVGVGAYATMLALSPRRCWPKACCRPALAEALRRGCRPHSAWLGLALGLAADHGRGLLPRLAHAQAVGPLSCRWAPSPGASSLYYYFGTCNAWAGLPASAVCRRWSASAAGCSTPQSRIYLLIWAVLLLAIWAHPTCSIRARGGPSAR